MPIYEYVCGCGYELETIQEIGTDTPTCSNCGGVMQKKPSPIAILILKNDSGYHLRSKGYKEGYKKEYLKSKNQEVWRDTIVGPQA